MSAIISVSALAIASCVRRASRVARGAAREGSSGLRSAASARLASTPAHEVTRARAMANTFRV